MGLFTILEGDQVVLVANGAFKQVDLYQRNGQLFAQIGGGFIKLNADCSTSKPNIRVDEISCDRALYRAPHGWLRVEGPGPGRSCSKVPVSRCSLVQHEPGPVLCSVAEVT